MPRPDSAWVPALQTTTSACAPIREVRSRSATGERHTFPVQTNATEKGTGSLQKSRTGSSDSALEHSTCLARVTLRKVTLSSTAGDLAGRADRFRLRREQAAREPPIEPRLRRVEGRSFTSPKHAFPPRPAMAALSPMGTTHQRARHCAHHDRLGVRVPRARSDVGCRRLSPSKLFCVSQPGARPAYFG